MPWFEVCKGTDIEQGDVILHLSQAFARFFMRVGPPHDAGAFVKEGAVGPRVTAE